MRLRAGQVAVSMCVPCTTCSIGRSAWPCMARLLAAWRWTVSLRPSSGLQLGRNVLMALQAGQLEWRPPMRVHQASAGACLQKGCHHLGMALARRVMQRRPAHVVRAVQHIWLGSAVREQAGDGMVVSITCRPQKLPAGPRHRHAAQCEFSAVTSIATGRSGGRKAGALTARLWRHGDMSSTVAHGLVA